MESPLQILNTVFGYESFREPQLEIIESVIAGENVLALMPTGAGKSLCYQIPSLLRSGCGVVVSPLIALMQDQVSALRQLGLNAHFLNSTLSQAEAEGIEQDLLSGNLDLLYIAPERLNQSRTIDLLHRSQIALFAIDEAHCVSQWGHDFRSDYLRLSVLKELFPITPLIALTATADDRTRTEIVQRLGLESAKKFITSFDRPNIKYSIELKQNAKQQLQRFLEREHPSDAGIVYCLSRNKTEDIAIWLKGLGYNALPYHAGLDSQTRASHQARFLREEGVIIVATIAFGMGIDKPDVRFVAHLDLPKTIEAYYQETGRAGRDGEPANAWMVYGLQDVIKLRQMMDQSGGPSGGYSEEKPSSIEHRRAEQHRLNAMLGLCEVTSCRRQALLNYFGELLGDPCGNCDCCINPAATWDGTESAQMALSACFRTGQRFGVNHLIDVLQGAKTAKVIQNNHQQLSTFGIGQHLDNNQWRSVFRQLVAKGYLSVDLNGYGALMLEERCRPLLRGEEAIELRKEVKQTMAKRTTKTPLPLDIDPNLWEVLRNCRRELADAQDLPPYVIFHDSTLQEMCIKLPQDLAAMSRISGVGQRKLEKYGREFLGVIHSYMNA